MTDIETIRRAALSAGYVLRPARPWIAHAQELIDAGHTDSEVARAVGMHPCDIVNARKTGDIVGQTKGKRGQKSGPRAERRKFDRDKALALASSGFSVRQIAAALNVSRTAIYRALIDLR